MGNNAIKNFFLTSIGIYRYKPIFHDIEGFTLLISSSDRFVEISPFSLEFISCIIESTSKCRIDIDFEIEYDI